MDRAITRRQVGMATGGAAMAAFLLGTGRVGAQGESTPGATPAVGSGSVAIPELDLGLQPGVVPTAFGDVTLPEQVERVVCVNDIAIDMCLAVGVTPVGIIRSSNGETAAAYLLDRVSPDSAYVGGWGELDVEAVLAVEPDLILGETADFEGDFAVLRDQFTCIGIGREENPDPNELQFWERQHLTWAHAIGQTEAARQAIIDLRTRAGGIQQTIGEHVGESVVVFRPQADFPVVMAQSWISGIALTWAGLTGNELTDGLTPPHSRNTVSLEQINLLDADWLFLAVRNAEQQSALETVWETNPLYQGLRAVQSGQVAVVPGDLWSGAAGVLAAGAMLDDIERIIAGGDTATPIA